MIAASLLTAAGLTDVSDLLDRYRILGRRAEIVKTRIEGESAMALLSSGINMRPRRAPRAIRTRAQ